MQRLHGIRPVDGDRKGEFHFGTIKFFGAIRDAQAFPGRNKYRNLIPWSNDEADQFLLAAGKLGDTFQKIDRAAELFDSARRRFKDFRDQAITAEEITAFQHATRDIALLLDVILMYLRILADCLADVTSQICRGKGVPRYSFRKHRQWFTQKMPAVDSKYAEILRNHTTWFTMLAGDGDKKGLRDLITHYRVRTQLIYLPGTTPDKNQVSAFLYGNLGTSTQTSLVHSIQTLVQGLFEYLDLYVLHFSPLIEAEIEGSLLDWGNPRSSILYEFETELSSSWLYPVL